MQSYVHISTPRGIRFDCSGCGNCCLHWPVPITQDDYERIRVISNEEAAFRPLKSARENLQKFTHTLEKRSDGRCQFLTEENRCQLHLEHGVAAKPSMCSLFPYSFTVTPDTVLSSLSFASSAVLYNNGKLLSEQHDVLSEQYKRFEELFKPTSERWHKLQVLDGTPLSWVEFSKIDASIMQIAESEPVFNEVPRGIIKKLRRIETHVLGLLPKPSLCERDPKLESRPKIVDQILLKYLDHLYFPEDVFADQHYDFRTRELMQELVAAPNSVSLAENKTNGPTKFANLISLKKLDLADEIEDLLDRFFYMRLFSKLFFGPGFFHLSLIAGLHHLQLLRVLLGLKLKQEILRNPETALTFERAAEIVRTLERRLTQLDLSRESVSVLEILCSSAERVERTLSL